MKPMKRRVGIGRRVLRTTSVSPVSSVSLVLLVRGTIKTNETEVIGRRELRTTPASPVSLVSLVLLGTSKTNETNETEVRG